MNWIGFGAGVASSLINAGTQAYVNAQNVEHQRQAQLQAQRFWYQQQAYNHPKNQVARIQEAGLNPDLLYGQSAGGVAGTASAPAQTINPAVMNPYMIDPMLVSNIAKTQADTDNQNEDTRGKKIVNDVNELTLLKQKYLDMGFTEQQTSYLAEQELTVIEQRENIKLERDKMKQQIDNLKQTYINLGLNAEILKKESGNLDLLASIYIAQEIGLQLSNEEQRIINANKDKILKSEIYKNNSEAISAIKNANAHERESLAREKEVDSANKLRSQQTETEKEKTGEHKYAKEIKRIDAEYRKTQNEMDIVVKATESVERVASSVDHVFSSFGNALKLGKYAKGAK